MRRRRRRRRWAHAPAICTASHVDHEKRVASVSISMHACGSFSIVMVLRLAALRAAGAPLIIERSIQQTNFSMPFKQILFKIVLLTYYFVSNN